MGTKLPPWRPELEAVDWHVQEFPINESTSYIIRMQTDDRNRLVEWAVIQMKNRRRIALYDVCHGKGYHLHLYNRTAREFAQISLRVVDSYEDMNWAYDDAAVRVSQYWYENERRSDSGR